MRVMRLVSAPRVEDGERDEGYDHMDGSGEGAEA
jgi:hypothetical protein